MASVEIIREKRNLGHRDAYIFIRKAVNMTLKAEGIEERCIVSVILTDDEGIRKKNKQYRDVDNPTDVLSFPLNDFTPGNFSKEVCAVFDPETEDIYLGDIMLNLKRCEEQGEEFGHGFDREIMYLTVHSMLHLLGYDHVDEGPMKAEMRAREKAIMGDD